MLTKLLANIAIKPMKKLFLSLFIFLMIATMVPAPALALMVTVQRGDTLSGLAAQYGTTIKTLAEANNIANQNLIYAGQQLDVDPFMGTAIPIVVADYSDSLASKISNTATSFTLTRGTDQQSRSLNGFYGFVIDSEYFTANCVATACTVVARGIDVVDGETQVTALKAEHRRGAVAKITNYPQLAILSRILNGIESASSTFMIGDGSTTTTLNKYLKIDNGTVNPPFIRYNETQQIWQFSEDGLNTVNFATSSANGLTPSSTAAVFVIDSKIGVYTSSTASTNGGYISIAQQADGTYRLYFNEPTYLAAPHTFSNINGTSTGNLTVNTPTSSRDVANKNYVDSALSFNTATGTAGAPNIYPGNALYISSTGTLFLADADATSTSETFIGISLIQASSTATVTFVKAEGVANIGGLTAGVDYYLSGTAGSITATRPSLPTLPVKIGRSLSTSRLLVKEPTINFWASSDFTNITSDQVVTIGVTPDHVKAYCGNESTFGSGNLGGTAAVGDWYWDRYAGTSSTQSFGSEDDNIPYQGWVRSDSVCGWEEGTSIFSARVVPSQTGFTFNLNSVWEGAARDATVIYEYSYP